MNDIIGFDRYSPRLFGFLADRGLSLVKRAHDQLHYSGPNFDVLLNYSSYSNELHLSVYKDDSTYSLSEIIRLADPENEQDYRAPAASTQVALDESLRSVRDLFERYSRPLFDEPELTFAKLQKQQNEWALAYERIVRLNIELPKANTAFKEKRYAEAVRLLSRNLQSLTPSNLKKLEYAKKKLSN